MTSMRVPGGSVTGGVDTHRDTHHAAVVDEVGRELGDAEFPATPVGYRRLLAWLRGFGALEQVGVEGTGSYGAGLARHLRAERVRVLEVDRPDRKTRRAKGKSDPIDAYAAARAVLSGAAGGTPKAGDGRVEAIRALRVARRGEGPHAGDEPAQGPDRQWPGRTSRGAPRDELRASDRRLRSSAGRRRRRCSRRGQRPRGRDQGRVAPPGPPLSAPPRRDRRSRCGPAAPGEGGRPAPARRDRRRSRGRRAVAGLGW